MVDTTHKRQKQLATMLDAFYSNPVAKVSLELFLTVGLVIFLAMFAIRPTLLTMSELLKEIEDKTELEEQLTKKVAALGSAQSIYLTIEKRLPVLDEAIPSDPETIKTLKIIEKIASENEVVIGSISLPEVPESDEATQTTVLSRSNLEMGISLAGDYTSIRDFVSGLQDSQRVFVVDSIVFRISENRKEKQLRATIKVLAPYFGTAGIANEKK
ncbi:MAG: type 4a pilus biogenesis protein PilO [Pseudomonadales bacterium]|nr:type 4a pilus biogenesis protein PilO [Pseudomonadales bacterium]